MCPFVHGGFTLVLLLYQEKFRRVCVLVACPIVGDGALCRFSGLFGTKF